MPSGITTDDGEDLDDIFAPLGAGTARANVGILANTQDISQRYYPSSHQQAGYTGPDDRYDLLTGISAGETDIRELFRSINFIGGFAFAIHPQPTTVVEGGPFTLSVTVQQAVGTVTYQWQKFTTAWENVAGQTSASYYKAVSDRTDQFLYRCVAVDSNAPQAPIYSDPAQLTVNYIPVFVTHPAGGTHNTGVQIVLTATITEGRPSPATVTWTKDGTTITNNAKYSGTSTLTLVINLDGTDHAASYRCRVFNAAGNSTSNAAVLLVNTPPVIASDVPTYLIINLGSTLDLSVGVYSYPAPTFQWYYNDASLGSSNGAQTSGLSIPNMQSANTGGYKCVVTNALGSAQSRVCVVQVIVPAISPSFTLHPTSQSVRQGVNVQFTATAYASPPASYQWKKNEVDIPGATSSTISLYGVTNADEGNYRCYASNVYGTAASNVASLNVVMDPYIVSGPTATDTSPNYGDYVSVSIVAGGDSISGYQWQLNGNNISGATGAAHVFQMDNVFKNGAYRCVVTNPYTSATSNSVNVTANITNPTITQSPVGFTGEVNTGPYALQCSATIPSSEGPVRFSWYKDGQLQAGPRTGNLSFSQDQHVIASLQYGQAGGWICVVTTDFGGGTNSGLATVVVV